MCSSRRLDHFLTTSHQVGIAAELPSGEYSKKNFDHIAFFDFLLQGGSSYERIPLERFDVGRYVLHWFCYCDALLTFLIECKDLSPVVSSPRGALS